MFTSILEIIQKDLQTPIVCRNEAYISTFGWADVETYLNDYYHLGPVEVIGPNGYKIKLPDSAEIRSKFVLDQVKSGHTFALRSMQRYKKELNNLCIAVESLINCYSQINIYGSFTNSSNSFGIHKDVSHNLIIQLEGECHWKVWNTDPVKEASLPRINTVLEKGDVLFIPKGYYHACYPLNRRLSLTLAFMNDISEEEMKSYLKKEWISLD